MAFLPFFTDWKFLQDQTFLYDFTCFLSWFFPILVSHGIVVLSSDILANSFQRNNSCALANEMLGSYALRKVIRWSNLLRTPFDYCLKTSWTFNFGKLTFHNNQAPLHTGEIHILDETPYLYDFRSQSWLFQYLARCLLDK